MVCCRQAVRRGRRDGAARGRVAAGRVGGRVGVFVFLLRHRFSCDLSLENRHFSAPSLLPAYQN